MLSRTLLVFIFQFLYCSIFSPILGPLKISGSLFKHPDPPDLQPLDLLEVVGRCDPCPDSRPSQVYQSQMSLMVSDMHAKTWTGLRTDDLTQMRLTKKQQILNENGEEIAEIEFKYMESSPLF